MQSLPSALAISGATFLAAVITLARSRAPLGSPLFFACTAVAGLAYAAMLGRVWREDRAPGRWLLFAFALAVAFRIPLAIPNVGYDNDMVRYVWDGRVQTLGYNPYVVLPADPAMANTHTAETRAMTSRRWPTPYPPAAQLFFRLVVTIHDSSRAMKFALLACDLLTILVVWRWLAVTGRREWLALAYAWNPLVVLEVAHSGHIDALGALWIAASAYWLTRRRTSLASIAFVLAVSTKLLPIVLLPLYWRRVRVRDALAGAALFVLLWVPFMSGRFIPLGQVANVVQYIRFNGPVFKLIAGATIPQIGALAAVVLGLAAAAWARRYLDVSNPAGWAWPMGIALACAPVIFPWYLLYFTPFLFTAATLPLLIWTLTVVPVYVVWELTQHGGRWVVPSPLMLVEYGLPLLAALVLLRRRRQVPAVPSSRTDELLP
ncbi:MAG: hypothetical protein ABJC89_05625 [Acidobacteriota bacterium]